MLCEFKTSGNFRVLFRDPMVPFEGDSVGAHLSRSHYEAAGVRDGDLPNLVFSLDVDVTTRRVDREIPTRIGSRHLPLIFDKFA